MTGTTGAIQPGAHGAPMAHGLAEEHPVFVQHKHPNYVLIFVILFVFTMLEVWVTTPLLGVTFPLPVIAIPTLLVLATLKFATIAGYYMHLRFDSRAFSALFIVGLLLAIGLLFTLQALFTAHHRLPFDAAAAREAGTLPPAAGEAGATPAAGTSAATGLTPGSTTSGGTASGGTSSAGATSSGASATGTTATGTTTTGTTATGTTTAGTASTGATTTGTATAGATSTSAGS